MILSSKKQPTYVTNNNQFYSLLGRVVESVEDVPDDEDGPHIPEDDAVEAQSNEEGQEHHVHVLPCLELHLPDRCRVFRSTKAAETRKGKACQECVSTRFGHYLR